MLSRRSPDKVFEGERFFFKTSAGRFFIGRSCQLGARRLCGKLLPVSLRVPSLGAIHHAPPSFTEQHDGSEEVLALGRSLIGHRHAPGEPVENAEPRTCCFTIFGQEPCGFRST
jgi:hypothetical protein